VIVATAVMCLAINIFHEARGETIPGQYAVALVTMNRAKKDPEQVCEVVFKRKQFSWTIGSYKKVKQGYSLSPHLTPKDVAAWRTAVIIARTTLSGRMLDFTHKANHYHADYVRPPWAASMRQVAKIGGHIFYVSSTQS